MHARFVLLIVALAAVVLWTNATTAVAQEPPTAEPSVSATVEPPATATIPAPQAPSFGGAPHFSTYTPTPLVVLFPVNQMTPSGTYAAVSLPGTGTGTGADRDATALGALLACAIALLGLGIARGRVHPGR